MPRVIEINKFYARTPADIHPKNVPSLGERIRALRREADELEQQQHAELMRLIATAFPGEVFSAGQVWQQPALQAACLDADIANPQQLGKWLRGERVERVGADHDGALWMCSGVNFL